MIVNCCPVVGVKPLISEPVRLLTPAPRLTVPVTFNRSYWVPTVVPPISTLTVDPEPRVTLPFAFRMPALAPGATVPPVAVIGPTVPVPPRVPAVRLTGLLELLPFTSKVPALMLVAPV